MERIRQQLDFLLEIDKIKGILRATLVLEGKRQENDAEHSWHMAMVAMTLKEYYNKEIKLDMEKVLKMILLHDVVEIYAGDVPAFGAPNPNKYKEELESAHKIFGLLPESQREEYLNIWLEFEEEESDEAKLAVACDRFQAFILNTTSDGHTWRKYGVHRFQVEKRMEPIKKYLPEVYEKLVVPQIHHYMNLGAIQHDVL